MNNYDNRSHSPISPLLPVLNENPRSQMNLEGEKTLPQPPFGSSAFHSLDSSLLKTFLLGKSAQTQKTYGRILSEFFDFTSGQGAEPLLLRDVGLSQLQAFLEIKSHHSHESQRLRSAVIRSFFAYALKTGYLKANPASFLPSLPAHHQIAERYLTAEEVIRMISLTENPRDRVLLKVLYSAGLRLSELRGLNWEHVQARDGLPGQGEGQRRGGGQLLILGKGNRKRTVVVSEGVYSDLISLNVNHAKPWEPVFTSREEGSPRISERRVQLIVNQARLRAGITKKVSPHWLRHAHASHALDRGAPIHLVQATLGHASVATTGKYLHARPQESSSRFLDI